jgi:protein tyrosine/serine phosphatase
MKTRSRWLLWTFLVLIGLVAARITWEYGVRKNFDVVVPGKIYRSGQPTKAQLEAWIHEYGLKSILSLRFGVAPYETELADRYRIKMYHIPFSAKKGLRKGQWEAIRALLTDESNLPVLVHCQGGGDRSTSPSDTRCSRSSCANTFRETSRQEPLRRLIDRA